MLRTGYRPVSWQPLLSPSQRFQPLPGEQEPL